MKRNVAALTVDCKEGVFMQIKRKQCAWLAWFAFGIAILFWVYLIWINPFVTSDTGWLCRPGWGGVLLFFINSVGAIGGFYHLYKTKMNVLFVFAIGALAMIFFISAVCSMDCLVF